MNSSGDEGGRFNVPKDVTVTTKKRYMKGGGGGVVQVNRYEWKQNSGVTGSVAVMISDR